MNLLHFMALGGTFNLGSLFASGEPGLWLDPSDGATGYQDSAATTAGVLDSPTGKRLDKSGRGNHVLQATSDARPTWKLDGAIYSDLFDGLSDGYATAAFSAGTLTSNMDLFVAIKRTTSSVLPAVAYSAPNQYIAYLDGYPTTTSNAGAPTTAVDGTLIGTAGIPMGSELATALTVGEWHIMEYRNLDLSGWTSFAVAGYVGNQFPGNIGGLILAPAQTDAKRAQIRNVLGTKVGLSI